MRLAGHDLWREEVAARSGLAYVPEHPDVTPYASILELLWLVCRLRGEPLQRADAVLAEAGLADRAHASVRELSAGQRRRALLAAAWIGTPRVALLDEPLESLDAAMRERVLLWIADLLRGGAAVVVVSHQLEPFVPLATTALTVRDGRTLSCALPLRAGAPPRAAASAGARRGCQRGDVSSAAARPQATRRCRQAIDGARLRPSALGTVVANCSAQSRL